MPLDEVLKSGRMTGEAAQDDWQPGGRWLLRHRSGLLIAENLLFLGEGFVWSGNEVIWRWVADGAGLHVSSLDGAPFLEFPRMVPEGEIWGRLAAGAADALDLELAPVPDLPALADSNRDLLAEFGLGAQGRTLLVSFNSAHRPYDARAAAGDFRWEFGSLPGRIGVDFARFAEGAAPLGWYTNKTRRIVAMLSGVLKNGYGQVVLCGISSGGYASLLFAELLCAAYPDIDFFTATINPQTGHVVAHRRFMAGLEMGMAPVLLSDAAYAARDGVETEIAALVTRRLARKGRADQVSHVIYYDSENPAERYYVNLVEGLPGFTLRPYKFGVGHMSGCRALYERLFVQDEVARICRGDL